MIGHSVKFKWFGFHVVGVCISYNCDDSGEIQVLHVIDDFGIIHKVYPRNFVESWL